MTGYAELDAMIRRLRGLRGMSAAAAREAAPLVEAAAKASADAGTTPSGAAWSPTKRDGDRALTRAASAVSARATGSVVQIVLVGHHIYHSLGIGRPKRQIIPDKGDAIPSAIAAAMAEGARRAFARLMGGS